MSLRARARHRGLHGHEHIDRQRLMSLLMFTTAIARMTVWSSLIVLSLIGVTFFVHLFQQVFWVALLSLYANWATDLSTAAGSWAALVGGDAHHDAEAARVAVSFDFTAIEHDIARLAELQPGPQAKALADQIRAQLAG
ncbi:MAG: hypothetical protein ACYCQK_02070 [Acidiferrobacteraceae bacterium]